MATAAPVKEPMSRELRNCVVCGLGSHRTDWINRYAAGNTVYVACDQHTDEQATTAIQKAENAKQAEAAQRQRAGQQPAGQPARMEPAHTPPAPAPVHNVVGTKA
jgi:hypothetical protein